MPMLYCKFCQRGCDALCFDSHRSRYYCHDSRCPGSEPRGSDRDRGRSSSSSTLRPEPPSRPPSRSSSSTLRPELSRSSSKRHGGHSSRSSSVRRTPERECRESISRSATPVNGGSGSGMCHSRDARTGERFSYPRNPHEDRDHMRICAKYPPPKRGCRYGYDGDGNVVSFAVSREADDYCDPADIDYRREQRPERPPSRSGSYRSGGGGGSGGGEAGIPRRSYSTRGRDYEDRGSGGLGRSYSTRDARPHDIDPGREGLGRRPSMSRRYPSSRDEYAYAAGGGGHSYDSSRPRYPPGYMNQHYGGGSWTGGTGPPAPPWARRPGRELRRRSRSVRL
ncbi:hypothetical protein PG997_010625 [Apiospora hydei]|uniref:Uncharacterized protein n=1 Tax=Apiospora hydei TaxID=1337664 RepID=A0ABR1VH07_9PEZI